MSVIINPAPSSSLVLPEYTITNVTTTRTFDGSNYTLDELANVLGTLITDLEAGGGQTYIVTNTTTDRTLDGADYSPDELANILGTLIQDLQADGILS